MPARKPPSNTSGLERTLRQMKRTGGLDRVPDALVSLLRTLAAAVDRDPTKAALVREYREALRELHLLGAADDVDVDAQQLLLTISTPVRAPVGDPQEP